MKKYQLKQPNYPTRTKIDYPEHLNSEQLDAVTNADGYCLVLAGAGSGKTRTLIYRVAYLLEKGAVIREGPTVNLKDDDLIRKHLAV